MSGDFHIGRFGQSNAVGSVHLPRRLPRRLLGLTWIGWLNCLVLQWLFLRLQWNDSGNGMIGPKKLIFAVPFGKHGITRPLIRSTRVVRKYDIDPASVPAAWTQLSLPLYECTHGLVFDQNKASAINARLSTVRVMWPRLDGTCPLGCGYTGIAYASDTHRIWGGW